MLPWATTDIYRSKCANAWDLFGFDIRLDYNGGLLDIEDADQPGGCCDGRRQCLYGQCVRWLFLSVLQNEVLETDLWPGAFVAYITAACRWAFAATGFVLVGLSWGSAGASAVEAFEVTLWITLALRLRATCTTAGDRAVGRGFGLADAEPSATLPLQRPFRPRRPDGDPHADGHDLFAYAIAHANHRRAAVDDHARLRARSRTVDLRT
jgi:hypothetical protein